MPQHLVDFMPPSHTAFSVQNYRDLALARIRAIHAADRVPVLVGGTHYYIESVLWNVLLDAAKDGKSTANVDAVPVDAMTNDQLYAELTRVDPVQAQRTHPNDRRRVMASLLVGFITTSPTEN